ncbi:putative F-box protein At5g52610 [Impatiens glandulifera]|uniref:putative F-box protein At5g52610 n=1 Tax=Impatiens glandulifera TaxID=253017 RepID=UPI001FB10AA0|nr:putative F-box protein At5g52610 [Impatiens glandulifera]
MGNFSLMPEDMLLNILSRLEIKDVFRSRPVCKEWNLLSRTHKFVSLHYEHSSQKRNENDNGVIGIGSPSTFILMRSVYTKANDDDLNCSTVLTLITLKKTSSMTLIKDEVDVPIESLFSSDVEFLRTSEDESIHVCSPFDGLICLANGYEVKLYNPATREVLSLPSPPPMSNFELSLEELEYCVLGVWFESESNLKRYKVFRMVNYGTSCKIQVFDSTENSWRVINNLVGRAYPLLSLLFNGVVHFYFEKKDSGGNPVLVTIDAKTEKFGHVELPSVSIHSDESSLLPYRGKLAFLEPNFVDGDARIYCDIWVMTEYGVEKSWTKQYSILVGVIDLNDMNNNGYLYYALAIWKCVDDADGDELVVKTYDGRIISFNLVTRKITDLDLSCVPYCMARMVPHNVETMLSLSDDLYKSSG